MGPLTASRPPAAPSAAQWTQMLQGWRPTPSLRWMVVSPCLEGPYQDEKTQPSRRKVKQNCATSQHMSSLRQEIETEMEVDVSMSPESPLTSSAGKTRDFWDANRVQGVSDQIVKIVIIGASGSGKSTAGNILLGREHFGVSSKTNPFVSETITAVTGADTRKGRYLQVLDTPDIYRQDLKEESRAKKEIKDWREKMGSEPDLILLTIASHLPDPGGDVLRYNRFKRLWGEDSVRRRLVVLFTFGDKVDTNNTTDLKSRMPQDFQDILLDASGRCVVFNNTLDARQQKQRVDQVFLLLDEITMNQWRGDSVNILIIGKTGNGKSTVGNVLLNKAAFRVSIGMASSSSRTETQTAPRRGFNINVTDTPDVTNLDLDADTAAAEIRRWKTFNPDVILLAVRCDVRYTAEEYQIYEQIRSALDKRYICKRLTVAFTFGEQEKNIKKDLKTVCQELKEVLKDADGRFLVFPENPEDKKEEYVSYLIGFAQKRKGTAKAKVSLQHSDAKEGYKMLKTWRSCEREHLHVPFIPPETRMEEVRVVLLGKTGSGKSSLGNSLLGRNVFQTARGLRCGTQRCEWAEATVDGIKLSVTDTPGLCDTHRKEEDFLVEVGKSIAVACPGPHVVIIVVQCNRRFTKEEYEAVKMLLALFGDGIRRHLLVVFTGGDDLGVPMDKMQQALEQQIKRGSGALKEVLCDACNRFWVVDNTGGFEKRQKNARAVIRMIQDLIRRNDGRYFTNDMVDKYNRKVQEAIQPRQREQHLSYEQAVTKTREAIAEGKEGPGFFKAVVNISKEYILSTVARVAETSVTGTVPKKCSVM